MAIARLVIVGVVGVLLCVDASTSGAEEIPAFARRYGLSCNACHNPIPKVNAFGESFAGNGFRLVANEPARDTIDTGDRLLELPRNVPLAVRLDAYIQAYNNGRSASDFKTPYNLKILSGGPIAKDLSYYFYFFLFERGEVGGIEDAFLHFNDIAGAPVDIAVGQFQISDPMFKRELRLEFEDYAIYRTRIGLQPADLTYDRGIMVSADALGATFTGEIVNGNGKGAAGEDRRLDNDPLKSVFGHVSRDVSGALRLGVMGYWGKQEGQVTEDDPLVRNTVWMVGGDATLTVGPVEINGQYIHREDSAPTFGPDEERSKTDGGFVEVLLLPPGSRWYGLALYNLVESNSGLLDVRLGGPSQTSRYQSLTAGVGHILRRNFRLLGEFTWDTELTEGRWTIGAVTAF